MRLTLTKCTGEEAGVPLIMDPEDQCSQQDVRDALQQPHHGAAEVPHRVEQEGLVRPSGHRAPELQVGHRGRQIGSQLAS